MFSVNVHAILHLFLNLEQKGSLENEKVSYFPEQKMEARIWNKWAGWDKQIGEGGGVKNKIGCV